MEEKQLNDLRALKKEVLVSSVDDTACTGPIYGVVRDKDGDMAVSMRINKKKAFGFRKNTGNKSILVAAPSGSVKKNCFVVPYMLQCLRRGESIIATDHFGELYKKYGSLFRDQGYTVRHLDFTTGDGDGWDPLKNCDNEVKAVEYLTTALCKSGVIDNAVVTPVLDLYVKYLLKAVLLRCMLKDSLYISNPLFSLADTNAFIDVVDNLLPKFPEQRSVRDGAIINACYEAWWHFKELYMSERLRSNMITSLVLNLPGVFEAKQAQNLLRNEIDLSLLSKERCAYFVTYPDNDQTWNPFVSLFLKEAFLALWKRSPVTVNFILDDFLDIGYIESINYALWATRRLNARAFLTFNSGAALKHVYKHTAESLLDSCDIYLGTGINDVETANVLAYRCGSDESTRTAIEQMDDEQVFLHIRNQPPVFIQRFHASKHPLAAKEP